MAALSSVRPRVEAQLGGAVSLYQNPAEAAAPVLCPLYVSQGLCLRAPQPAAYISLGAGCTGGPSGPLPDYDLETPWSPPQVFTNPPGSFHAHKFGHHIEGPQKHSDPEESRELRS